MTRKRILVVEDYQQLRDLIGNAMREVGSYAVDTAADGTAARRIIAQQCFDLLVLDIGVPGLVRVEEIASAARARFGCAVLFITGRDLADSDVVELMRTGDRFLRKPFKMKLLLAEVGAMLRADAPRQAKAAKRMQGSAPKVVQEGTS